MFSLFLFAALTAAPPLDRNITVAGDAELRVVPDQVQLSLGILSYDKSLSKSKSLNDERVKKTLSALAAQGIEPKHMQTDHLSVQPRRDSSSYGKSYSDTPDGYEVRRTLVVTIKDPKKFEAIVTAVLESGTNEIEGIQFLTTELRKHRDAARALALKAAREKATAMSGELGTKLGKVRSISENSSGWSYWSPRSGGANFSQNVMQNVGGGGGEPSEDGFAPGMISVRASVSVAFDLEGG